MSMSANLPNPKIRVRGSDTLLTDGENIRHLPKRPSERHRSNARSQLIPNLGQRLANLDILFRLFPTANRFVARFTFLELRLGHEFPLADDSPGGESHSFFTEHGCERASIRQGEWIGVQISLRYIGIRRDISNETLTQNLPLHIPHANIPQSLIKDKRAIPMLPRISVGCSDDPGRGIADGRIKDLAEEDVSVETSHDLVDGGGVVPVMKRHRG
jgi:hypothetical protein